MNARSANFDGRPWMLTVPGYLLECLLRARDRREVIGAQRAGVAATNLVYHHGRPKEEPLLWLAAAIAGAVARIVGRRV